MHVAASPLGDHLAPNVREQLQQQLPRIRATAPPTARSGRNAPQPLRDWIYILPGGARKRGERCRRHQLDA
eukprot:6885488-Pyramimonas_sp.AAC.1